MTTEKQKIEEALKGCLPQEKDLRKTLFASMEYSLMAGGKRLRPQLVLEFCRLCGGSEEQAMPFACAVEMIHSYSLIHDDLPCMDDDDLRRGKPTNHKVYGEAAALLAGDALLTLAFETMLSPESVQAVGADRAAAAAGELARAAGAHGMVGGQIIDLESEGKQVPLEVLEKMDEGKTGALILAACRMGCILAGASEDQKKAAEVYARSIGLAFQIEDDLLDVTGDAALLGKNTGMDSAREKSTYVSLLGVEKARETVERLTRTAVDALEVFGEKAQPLAELALALQNRDH